MLYVQRGDTGSITAVMAERCWDGQESLSKDHPDVLDFLGLTPEKRRISKIKELKAQSRAKLTEVIGDWGDNLTDVLRLVVLGWAIRAGEVGDPDVTKAHDDYCRALFNGYGGAAAIVPVLIEDAVAFQKYIVDGYYVDKERAQKATDEELDALAVEE
jgi:hypothetical protein